ncbi:hypothetical protein A2U01_0047763 [Trifolium medium]|uniref:Uncharacterized protein n=1 Tax=Trifolium medium TaxID=97028 RepID=A0A392QRF1_9FABA|nr:hypothetical protein [Trifolium medium]
MDKAKEKKAPNPLDNLKDYFQKKYPNNTEDEIMIKVLDQMKNQFFKTFPTTKDDTMSTSSVGSNTFDCLAGESQPEEAALEDYWNAMIQSMKKGK